MLNLRKKICLTLNQMMMKWKKLNQLKILKQKEDNPLG